MMYVKLLVVVAVVVADQLLLASASCTWNGHTFAEGTTYKPDPCTYCSCREGQPMCAIQDCAFIHDCVDFVREPDNCCPVCRKFMEPPTQPTLATPSTSCTWKGHSFAEGTTYQPDPCTFCSCSGGQPTCPAMLCAPPQCVDMVHDPTQCCPTCPNGPNCRAPDGTIISSDQEVTLADGRHCRCANEGGVFMMQLDAVCSVN